MLQPPVAKRDSEQIVQTEGGRRGESIKKKKPSVWRWRFAFPLSNNTNPFQQWCVTTSRADASESGGKVTQENHVVVIVACVASGRLL